MKESRQMCGFIFILLFISFISTTVVDECYNLNAPSKVEIQNCDKPPCKVVLGESTKINMTFTARNQLTSLTPKLEGRFGFIMVPYPLDEKDGCKSLIGQQCPLQRNDTATYSLEIIPKKYLRKINSKITFTLQDQKNENVFCFKLLISIVDQF